MENATREIDDSRGRVDKVATIYSGFSVFDCNMSSESGNQSKQNKFAYATIRMPDGKEHEIPLAPKQFKTGREGYYAQIPSFVYNDNIYGGQIQLWKKTK